MNRRAIRHLAVSAVALLLLVDSAVAQYQYLGYRSYAPSTRVGRVGRRQGFRVPTLTRQPTWSGAAATMGAGTFRQGSRGAYWGLPPLAAAVTLGRPQVQIPSATGLYQSRTMQTARPIDLMKLSGLSSALRYTTPLTRTQWNYQPQLRTPLYVPQPQSSVFHDFFGLRPSEPFETELDATPIESLAAILQEDTQQRVSEVESRAYECFREATRAEVENRQQKLARAIDLFQSVYELDKEAYMPSLLTIHAALERDQLVLASRALFATVRRNPQVFSERPDIAEHFGDPTRLEEQTRKYLRVGDENPQLPQAYAVQAYCAWVLDDRTRATQALRLADEISRGEPEHGRIRAFKAALEAALR